MYQQYDKAVRIVLDYLSEQGFSKTLHKELDGYSEYAKLVEYRLFPGVW